MNYLITRVKFFLCNFPNHYPAALRTMLPIVRTAMVTDKEKTAPKDGFQCMLSVVFFGGLAECIAHGISHNPRCFAAVLVAVAKAGRFACLDALTGE